MQSPFEKYRLAHFVASRDVAFERYLHLAVAIKAARPDALDNTTEHILDIASRVIDELHAEVSKARAV